MALLDAGLATRLDPAQNKIVAESKDLRPILAIINAVVWQWYREQQHDMDKPLFVIKKWNILSFTIRVRHLEDILTYIFGKPA
jgi:hypothetical protein